MVSTTQDAEFCTSPIEVGYRNSFCVDFQSWVESSHFGLLSKYLLLPRQRNISDICLGQISALFPRYIHGSKKAGQPAHSHTLWEHREQSEDRTASGDEEANKNLCLHVGENRWIVWSKNNTPNTNELGQTAELPRRRITVPVILNHLLKLQDSLDFQLLGKKASALR